MGPDRPHILWQSCVGTDRRARRGAPPLSASTQLSWHAFLKMGLHDTFDFDEAAYRAKCAERPTSKLQEEEVRKLRQHFAASASMAIGLSHAVQTAGLTLGVSAFGLRRYYVAKEKLAIIRQELTKRGVALHDMSKRDAYVPPTRCSSHLLHTVWSRLAARVSGEEGNVPLRLIL